MFTTTTTAIVASTNNTNARSGGIFGQSVQNAMTGTDPKAKVLCKEEEITTLTRSIRNLSVTNITSITIKEVSPYLIDAIDLLFYRTCVQDIRLTSLFIGSIYSNTSLDIPTFPHLNLLNINDMGTNAVLKCAKQPMLTSFKIGEISNSSYLGINGAPNLFFCERATNHFSITSGYLIEEVLKGLQELAVNNVAAVLSYINNPTASDDLSKFKDQEFLRELYENPNILYFPPSHFGNREFVETLRAKPNMIYFNPSNTENEYFDYERCSANLRALLAMAKEHKIKKEQQASEGGEDSGRYDAV